jgi:hypothetical protein
VVRSKFVLAAIVGRPTSDNSELASIGRGLAAMGLVAAFVISSLIGRPSKDQR